MTPPCIRLAASLRRVVAGPPSQCGHERQNIELEQALLILMSWHHIVSTSIVSSMETLDFKIPALFSIARQQNAALLLHLSSHVKQLFKMCLASQHCRHQFAPLHNHPRPSSAQSAACPPAPGGARSEQISPPPTDRQAKPRAVSLLRPSPPAQPPQPPI